MNSRKYRIAKIGAPVGAGVSGSYYVDLSSIAKENTANAPYCIPNEFICGEIGRILGLPVPPVSLISSTATGTTMFASLNFNFEAHLPPLVDPRDCVAILPELSSGLIVFDAYIGNQDRHRGNLSIDNRTSPPHMDIFDHSHALLGFQAGQGRERVLSLYGTLGILATGFQPGNRHCLIDFLGTSEHIQGWLNKIKQIPDFFIDDICEKVRNIGTTDDEIAVVKTYLKDRRTELAGVFNQSTSEFPQIGQTRLYV